MTNNQIIAEYLQKISPEELARMFHGTYERLAPDYGYLTRKESRKDWEEVPQKNRELMVATCREILDVLVVSEIGDEIGMP